MIASCAVDDISSGQLACGDVALWLLFDDVACQGVMHLTCGARRREYEQVNVQSLFLSI